MFCSIVRQSTDDSWISFQGLGPSQATLRAKLRFQSWRLICKHTRPSLLAQALGVRKATLAIVLSRAGLTQSCDNLTRCLNIKTPLAWRILFLTAPVYSKRVNGAPI